MKPLKVAFFAGEFPILSETFVIRQVVGLVKAGHEVTVIAGKWGDQNCGHETYRSNHLERRVKAIREGLDSTVRKLQCLTWFAVRSVLLPRDWRPFTIAVRAALNGSSPSLLDIAAVTTKPLPERHLGHYDAIIAHFGPSGVRAMHLQQAGLLDGPLAVVFHGSDMSHRATLARERDNYRALFVHASRLLPISYLWSRRLIEWGASPDKIEVLRMGVDLDRLGMLDPTRPLHVPLYVLSVARFTEKKGLRYAIEGIVAAKGAIRYEIIGSGPLDAELRTLAAKAPADKDIEFLGTRSQQEVFARLEQADVFLLPSVTAEDGDMEGIPVALMEAMAKGVLVLATEHSGIPELIVDGRSGLLVPERNAAAIAKTINDIGVADDRVATIRGNARKAVELAFNNEQLDVQCRRICRDLAQARTRG